MQFEVVRFFITSAFHVLYTRSAMCTDGNNKYVNNLRRYNKPQMQLYLPLIVLHCLPAWSLYRGD
jgi:hypothetical protein